MSPTANPPNKEIHLQTYDWKKEIFRDIMVHLAMPFECYLWQMAHHALCSLLYSPTGRKTHHYLTGAKMSVLIPQYIKFLME